MTVFLGGTCNGSNWRSKLIPLLVEEGIDYFDPVVDDWDEDAQEEELLQREFCDFVLYTITPKMEGVYSIAEVVDCSNKRPYKTILLVLLVDGSISFTVPQAKSLSMVADMVADNGGIVVSSFEEVVQLIIQ